MPMEFCNTGLCLFRPEQNVSLQVGFKKLRLMEFILYVRLREAPASNCATHQKVQTRIF